MISKKHTKDVPSLAPMDEFTQPDVPILDDDVVDGLVHRIQGGQRAEESEDPWKHRSVGMTCKTCMWYVMKQTSVPGVAEIGRCRRHAPTMNGYPVVYVTDWCGDHKVDENKL